MRVEAPFAFAIRVDTCSGIFRKFLFSICCCWIRFWYNLMGLSFDRRYEGDGRWEDLDKYKRRLRFGRMK